MPTHRRPRTEARPPAEWRPLPPRPRGRHRRAQPPVASPALALMVVTMLGVTTTALALPPADVSPPTVAATELVRSTPSTAPDPTVPSSVSGLADAPTAVAEPGVPSSVPAPPDPTLPPPGSRAPTSLTFPSAPSTIEPAGRSITTTTLVTVEEPGAGRLGLATSPEAPVLPDTVEECRQRLGGFSITVDGKIDRNAVAQLAHAAFSCVLTLAGYDEEPPTSRRGWDGAARGFDSLADQIAAEAVVVGYCESLGFDPDALYGTNPWGYAGLFQMGRQEMRRFGPPGGDRLVPADNALAAATYLVWMERRGGWGGWGPWAVVNTNFDDEVNDRVKVPVLPRFTSTDPEFRGRRGAELPEWAIDPWSYEVPAWNGCPTRGGSWPEAQPLGG